MIVDASGAHEPSPARLGRAAHATTVGGGRETVLARTAMQMMRQRMNTMQQMMQEQHLMMTPAR